MLAEKKISAWWALIFLIRIRILIVRNINFSAIKDIRSYNMLYHLGKKILQHAEGVADPHIALFDDDRNPSRFFLQRENCTWSEVIIHALAGCAITSDF